MIQIQPAEGIQLHFQTKVPEAGMRLRMTDLDFRFQDEFLIMSCSTAPAMREIVGFEKPLIDERHMSHTKGPGGANLRGQLCSNLSLGERGA